MMQTLLEAKRAWLLPYLQGWAWKLDECCDGAHIHRKGQLRQKIASWLDLLHRPELSLEEINQIEQMVPETIAQARKLYLEHLSIKDAEREQETLRKLNTREES